MGLVPDRPAADHVNDLDSHDAALTRVIAVRHGETTWNAEARMQGQLDTALSARGRWQAERLGAALAGAGIDVIVASDLSRAFDTAQAVARRTGLPVATDAGLRERSFGVFQGSTYAEIDARWPAEAARWRRHEPDFGAEGGETLRDFSDRAVAAASRIAARHRGRTVLLATHGGVLDCLYRAATRIPLGAPRSWELANASINRLLFTDQGCTLVGWNDVAHLDGATLDDGGEGEAMPAAAERPS